MQTYINYYRYGVVWADFGERKLTSSSSDSGVGMLINAAGSAKKMEFPLSLRRSSIILKVELKKIVAWKENYNKRR